MRRRLDSIASDRKWSKVSLEVRRKVARNDLLRSKFKQATVLDSSANTYP